MESRFSDSKPVSLPQAKGGAPAAPAATTLAVGLSVALAFVPGAATADVYHALPALALSQDQGVEVFEASIPDLQDAPGGRPPPWR